MEKDPGSHAGAVPPDGTSANESHAAIRRNVLVGIANLVRATLIGLLLTPVLIRALGDTSFGVWSLILGAAGYIGLAEAGISTALVAKVASTEAMGDRQGLTVLLRSGRVLLAGSATVGALIVLALSAEFGSLFDVPSRLDVSASIGMLLLGASYVIGIVETSWTAALVGIGRVDATSLVGLALTTTAAVLQVVMALLGASIVGLASVSLAIAVISLCVNRQIMHRMLAELPRAAADWPTIKSLLTLSLRNFLVAASGLLAFGSDVILVGVFAGANAAAAYAVASRAATFTRNLATSASDVLVPSFGSAVARGDISHMRGLYRSASFLGLFIALPVAVAFFATAEPLLELWTGSDLAGAGLTLTVLAALTAAQIPGHVAFIALMGAQRSELLLRFSLPSTVVNLGLSIAFTARFGVAGPAFGSLLTTLIIDPLLIRRMSGDLLGMNGWAVYRELLPLTLPPLIIVSPLAVAARLGIHAMPRATAPLTAAGLGAVVAALTFLWLRLSRRGVLVAPAVRQLPILGPRLAQFVAPVAATSSAPAEGGAAD